MNLNVLQMGICSQIVVAEFDIWIDSHTATPNKDLIVVGKRQTMIVAKTEILDKHWTT